MAQPWMDDHETTMDNYGTTMGIPYMAMVHHGCIMRDHGTAIHDDGSPWVHHS